MIGLKKLNPDLKILLGVGGWSHEDKDSPFSYIVKTSKRRIQFALRTASFLRKYGKSMLQQKYIFFSQEIVPPQDINYFEIDSPGILFDFIMTPLEFSIFLH